MIRLHFIGGEKGGVGKSVMARLLAQYLIDQGENFSVFDADASHGAMLRHYREYSSAVDLNRFESADSIIDPAVNEGRHVIVDLPAQSMQALSRWLNESGLIGLSRELGMATAVWHVMDDGSDSLRLLGTLLEQFGVQPDYVLVRNFGRGGDFQPFDQSTEKATALNLGAQIMDLPALHAPTMRKIDRIDASFWAAVNNDDAELGPCLGLLERQRVKMWLKQVYAALDAVHQAWAEGPAPAPDAN